MYQLIINGSYITEWHSDFIQLVIVDRISNKEKPSDMVIELRWIEN